jgi:hypothetical protein
VRVFFSVLNPPFLRYFDSVVDLLAERGHSLHFAFHERAETAESDPVFGPLLTRHPGISYSAAPVGGSHGDAQLALQLRACIDYLQFLHPRFHSTYLARAEARVPATFRELVSRPAWRSAPARAALAWALRQMNSAVPSDSTIRDYIAQTRPDIALFTPYVGLSTAQPDYLKAAQDLGLRTAVCVASWDNLSSKSLIVPQPDLVTVWNEWQKKEAVQQHHLPANRVAVTGAQNFDQWFTWQPRSREAFCERVGLDPRRPYVCYVGFTPFKGSPPERLFVEKWLQAVRSAPDNGVRNLGILIRPHPKRVADWKDADLSSLENVVVWPTNDSTFPTSEEARQDYFDSLYHSASVVGLNTSALIEAGIVGRPVHTVLVPEYWASQEGTLHFQYLQKVGGGLLRSARDLEEHVRQLAEAITPGWSSDTATRFVREFVRPHGLDQAATPFFVEALEALQQRGSSVPWDWGLGAVTRVLLLKAARLLAASSPARKKRAVDEKSAPKRRKA